MNESLAVDSQGFPREKNEVEASQLIDAMFEAAYKIQGSRQQMVIAAFETARNHFEQRTQKAAAAAKQKLPERLAAERERVPRPAHFQPPDWALNRSPVPPAEHNGRSPFASREIEELRAPIEHDTEGICYQCKTPIEWDAGSKVSKCRHYIRSLDVEQTTVEQKQHEIPTQSGLERMVADLVLRIDALEGRKP